MALRYLLLAVGAVSVLGVSLYLALEVRARPAPAQVQPQPQPEPMTGAEPSRAAPARTPIVREPPRGPDGEPEDPAPQKLDALMNEANKAYDRSDWDEAKAIARKVLKISPNNVRMLRIVVSSSCITGENAEAQSAYVLLPRPDREQMQTRCARYGLRFTEP